MIDKQELSYASFYRTESVIFPSLLKRVPSNLFIKGTNRNKPRGSCKYSSRLVLNFVEFLFLVE